MAITWRNIDIGSNAAANSLLNAGADRVMRGLDTLGNVAEQQGNLNVQNYDTVAKQNTTDALAKLNTINTSTDLAAAMRGGALDTNTLDNTFGKQYDKGMVSNAATAKLTALASSERALAEKNKTEAERLADRLESQRLSKKKEGQLDQAHAMSMADYNMKMATMKRERDYDGQASEIIRTAESPEIAKSRLSKLALDINKDGLLPADRLFTKQKSFTDQINGVGLDTATRERVGFEQEQAMKIGGDYGAKVDKLLNEYRKSAGFDPKIEEMALDPMSPGDAVVELEKQIKDKGVTNTVPIAARVEEINNAFEKNGLDHPSGRILKEILTQGGHDDKFFGFDAKFELNREFMNNIIAKSMKNRDYKSLNAENEVAFLEAKARGTDVINQTRANNAIEREQEAYAKRFTNHFKEAQIIPLDSVRDNLEMQLKELRKNIKSNKVPDPTIQGDQVVNPVSTMENIDQAARILNTAF
jgi:hypothetical protein